MERKEIKIEVKTKNKSPSHRDATVASLLLSASKRRDG